MIRIRRSSGIAKSSCRRRLRNLVFSGLAGAITVLPLLLHHQYVLRNYYIRLHAMGPERYVRARMFRVDHWPQALWFYPQSLYLHHLGAAFLVVAGILLLIAAFRRFVARQPVKNAAHKLDPFITFALFAALLIPLCALTWDVDKNPSVGDIMVGPLLLLLLMFFRSPANVPRPASGVSHPIVTGFVVLVIGLTVQIYSYTRHLSLYSHRNEVNDVIRLYDKIDAVSRQNRWAAPIIADDAFSDYQFVPAINTVEYERHGRLLNAHESLAVTVVSRPTAEVLAALQISHFAIVSTRINPRDVEDPFESSTRLTHQMVLDYCKRYMVAIGQCRIMGRIVVLYARPAP
jgi:hypothetical protein